MTWSRVGSGVAAFFFGIFCLPPLIFGIWLLSLWVKIQVSGSPYLDYPYLTIGLAFVCLGVFEVLCLTQGMRKSGAWRLLVAIPVIAGLWTALNIPEIVPYDREGLRYVSEIAKVLDSFGREHRRFPENKTKLEKVIPGSLGPSPYRNSGQPLAHRSVLIADATGPYSGTAGDEPGVLFYAVSRDFHDVWLTETQLDRPVGGRVQFVQILLEDGFSTSLHRQVSPKWPAE